MPTSLYLMALNRVLERGSLGEVQHALRWAPPTGGASDPAFRSHVLCSLARRTDSPGTLVTGALEALGALPQDVLNRDVAMAGTDPAVWRAVLQAQPGPRDEAFWVRALKTIPRDVVLHMQAHPEAVDAALISAIGRGRRTQLLGPACAALLARREQGRPDHDGLTPLDHVLARAALTFKAGRHRRYDDIGNAPLNVRRRLEHLRSAYQSLCAHGADSAASHTRLRARYGTGLDQAVRAIVRAWNSAPDAPVDNRDSRALPRRR